MYIMTEDIHQSQISYFSFELLLQEIVPTSIRVSKTLSTQSTQPSLPTTTAKPDSTESNQDKGKEEGDYQTRIDTQLSSIANDLPGTINILDTSLLPTDDVTIRIEQLGFNLGLKISELLLYQNSSTTKIIDILDIMKFICRDVWKCFYNKQIDNLRTNHRGIFVLIDNNYKLINQFSSSSSSSAIALEGHSSTDQDTLKKSKVYLWFPCGVIRGILMSFGVESNVSAEITQFPSVMFNIHTSINN
ncbi:Trs33 TRAPP complex subunit [Candida orthopsilosis Co 90-125]|uniref:Trs33 TRAPP complex subunit n=1 Tax=Candida orthopsilosis (strain 90-125) TaxID=1136231 RepID=H8XAY8_CANO9|nr:Trs33 TRAPP complex subunit [Candida orthopsilosis Co 90-125]CCG25236.1 Trs33 TRAPP complex subunit [Candida orthopsilosis Co 90-125]